MTNHTIFISGHSPEWHQSLAVAFKQSGYEKTFAEDQGDLIQHVMRIYPDVVLRRVENHTEAMDLIKKLKEVSPFSIAVIIVDNPDHFNLPELITAGVMGCLPIRLRPRQIVAAVDLIASAGIVCIPRLSPRQILEHNENRSSDLLSSLTGRELEVLKLLGDNKTNQEMADELYLSISTIKTHLRSIFRKLSLKSRREAQELLREIGFNDKNSPVRPVLNQKVISSEKKNDTKLYVIK